MVFQSAVHGSTSAGYRWNTLAAAQSREEGEGEGVTVLGLEQ